MAKGSIPKYLRKRWEPRVGQSFSVAAGENIYESKRQDFIHDAYLPYCFRSKEQIRGIRAYMASALELREKYGVPAITKPYIFIDAKGAHPKENFGSDLMDWYYYENGFIIPDTALTEDIAHHAVLVRNYLSIIEDIYIDEYWKYKMSKVSD